MRSPRDLADRMMGRNSMTNDPDDARRSRHPRPGRGLTDQPAHKAAAGGHGVARDVYVGGECKIALWIVASALQAAWADELYVETDIVADLLVAHARPDPDIGHAQIWPARSDIDPCDAVGAQPLSARIVRGAVVGKSGRAECEPCRDNEAAITRPHQKLRFKHLANLITTCARIGCKGFLTCS